MAHFLSACTLDALSNAAHSLRKGSLVAFPTETVYGIGADANNAEAVARIYEVKGRPAYHPLIVHIAGLQHLDQWISDIPEYAIALTREFWPGPMTLILERSEIAKDFITGGQGTVGIRIPQNSVALGLLEAFHKLGGAGVAAPSANRFGQVSPTTAEAVREELGAFLDDRDLVLDGGPSEVGLESTIIDCTSETPQILRPGAITRAMIKEATGLEPFTAEDKQFKDLGMDNIRVSGTFENHYSPNARVFLDKQPSIGDGFIALEDVNTPAGAVRLAAPRSVEEFAQVLYASLRKGDHLKLDSIYIAQPTGDGLAIAIRDRLSRSSKGR
jgi:L-threonylcarbamoyladenylate synthase